MESFSHRKRTNRGKVGAVPGTIVIDDDALPTRYHSIKYHAKELQELDGFAVPEEDWVVWQDAVGLGDSEALRSIQDKFTLHPLVMEDVVNVSQRPKIETHVDGVFCVLRRYDFDGEHLDQEQLSFFLGDHFVFTFQERDGDCFEAVRRRLRESQGRIRNVGEDYLFYALIDAVVDSYFPVVETIRDTLYDTEQEILRDFESVDRKLLYQTRGQIMELRRAVWPIRDIAIGMAREDDWFTNATRPFIRDIQDHSVELVDELDSMRELVTTLLELQASQLSNRMNQVMHVLTVMSSIFIPLGFLAGLYGMNFNTDHPTNLPELNFEYGYVTLLLFMFLIVVVSLAVFKKKRWI